MHIETIDILLLGLMVLAALWTVLTTRLLRSVIGLAVTSVILTILLFRLNSPLAAVFELSVCAGLISAIFLSVIGLTKRIEPHEYEQRKRERLARFWYLPVILVLVGAVLMILHVPVVIKQASGSAADVRSVLWVQRHLDMLGQIIVLLGGAFGVVLLFKERKHG